MDLLIAPVQGHTDAAFRHFHNEIYGGGYTYYTPFIRFEKGGIRPKDLKDMNSELNSNHHLVPQIIFRDEKELNSLIELIKEEGFREIDLNMGCPFPLQTGHGRGAATISNKQLGEAVVKAVKENPEINFSVKMRLGLSHPEEWKSLLPILNNVTLRHIVVHPRIARQQYGGYPDLMQFGKILQQSKNPVIYNGDIKTPADIKRIQERNPGITGIMIGRGLLGRPSLAMEVRQGKEMDKKERIAGMLEFHRRLFAHYSEVLCGDSQIISKIQPFWEYAEDEIGRKAWKSIKKAGNLAKYQTAVAMIEQ